MTGRGVMKSNESVTLPTPQIRPAVFLTGPNLISEPDDIQRINVYGREGAATAFANVSPREPSVCIEHTTPSVLTVTR